MYDTSIPAGLEHRVLAAIHAHQQRQAARWRQGRVIAIAALTAISLASSFFFLHTLFQNGFHMLLTTIVLNYQLVPLRDTLLALLESIPVGSLSLVLSSTAALCFLLSKEVFAL